MTFTENEGKVLPNNNSTFFRYDAFIVIFFKNFEI